MDNVNSFPQIQVPSLPTNFEALAGATKRKFAEALLNVIRQSTVSGVTTGVADVAALQQAVTIHQQEIAQLQDQVNALTIRVEALEAAP